MNDRQDSDSNSKTAYFEVETERFRNATKEITFDVFLRLSEDNYAHVFSKMTGLDYRRLAQYRKKGVESLYVKEEDRDHFEEYIAQTANDLFSNPNVSREKKIAALLNMTEQNLEEVFGNLNVTKDTAESSKKVVKNYVSMMSDNPKTLGTMLKLVSHGEYLYFHSIAVAVFSMFIARGTGQFNRRMVEITGLGGFLHDIGNTQLDKEITEASRELTPSEWKLMRTHTKLGLQMIENTANIPDEVRYIVYQHHEEPGGGGYPNGLRSSAIYYPAKIVALADGFSALISKRPFRPAFSMEQALHIIQSEKGKYEPALVDLLSGIFSRQYNRAA